MIRTIESCTTSSSFRVVDDVVNGGGGNNTDSESGSEHSSVSVAVTASDKDNGSFMLYIYTRVYIYIWTSVVLSPFKNRVFTKRLSHHYYSKRKKDHSLLL